MTCAQSSVDRALAVTRRSPCSENSLTKRRRRLCPSFNCAPSLKRFTAPSFAHTKDISGGRSGLRQFAQAEFGRQVQNTAPLVMRVLIRLSGHKHVWHAIPHIDLSIIVPKAQ